MLAWLISLIDMMGPGNFGCRPSAGLAPNKQNLGLEVTAKELPIDILVIDQAEKLPVEN